LVPVGALLDSKSDLNLIDRALPTRAYSLNARHSVRQTTEVKKMAVCARSQSFRGDMLKKHAFVFHMCPNTQTNSWTNCKMSVPIHSFLNQEAAMPDTRSTRILYVDDDADSRSMLSTLLACPGTEITSVANAAEAWPLIQTNRFDLYLLEAWLPGLDGFELCRQIRSAGQQTPVLFFSAAAYETDKKQAAAAGAYDYVTKPDIESLLGRISNFLSTAQVLAA
jgi:CheY-like chemotaxis protein